MSRKGRKLKYLEAIIDILKNSEGLTFTEIKKKLSEKGHKVSDSVLSRNLQAAIEQGLIERTINSKHLRRPIYKITKLVCERDVRKTLANMIMEKPLIEIQPTGGYFILGNKEEIEKLGKAWDRVYRPVKMGFVSVDEQKEIDLEKEKRWLVPLCAEAWGVDEDEITVVEEGNWLHLFLSDIEGEEHMEGWAGDVYPPPSPEGLVKFVVWGRLYTSTTVRERERLTRLFGKLVWLGELVGKVALSSEALMFGSLKELLEWLIEPPEPLKEKVKKGTWGDKEYIADRCFWDLIAALKYLGFELNWWEYTTPTTWDLMGQALFDFMVLRKADGSKPWYEYDEWLEEAHGTDIKELVDSIKKEMHLVKKIYDALAPIDLVLVWAPCIEVEKRSVWFESMAVIREIDSWLEAIRDGRFDDDPVRLKWIVNELERFVKRLREHRDELGHIEAERIPIIQFDKYRYTNSYHVFKYYPGARSLEFWENLLKEVRNRWIQAELRKTEIKKMGE